MMDSSLNIKADLHCHSHYSDGTLAPAEVVDLAYKHEVNLLSLTDHDSIDGLDQARAQAEHYGIHFIAGVEVSATWNQQTLHIVGLNIDPNNEVLLQGLASNCALRAQRSNDMLNKLDAHGIDIRQAVEKQLPDGGVPTRTHIARALIDTGAVKNMNAAFKRYLGAGKIGYVPSEWADMRDVVAWISAAGGVAVLAHPMRYRLSATKLRMVVRDFVESGGKALEVVTATQDAKQTRDCITLVQDNQLLASTGSDFHSLDQPWAVLGRCPALPSSVQPVWEYFL